MPANGSKLVLRKLCGFAYASFDCEVSDFLALYSQTNMLKLRKSQTLNLKTPIFDLSVAIGFDGKTIFRDGVESYFYFFVFYLSDRSHANDTLFKSYKIMSSSATFDKGHNIAGFWLFFLANL